MTAPDATVLATLAMQARHCARPVLFETGDADYPYQISGSSSLLRRRGYLFVVSAAHLLTNFSGGEPEADHLRVPYTAAAPLNRERAFVSHDAMLRVRPETAEKAPDWADLFVAPLCPDLTDESLFRDETPFNLDRQKSFTKHGTVLIRGFPTKLRTLDPDHHKMTYEPLDLIGKTGQAFGNIEGLLQVDLLTEHGLASLDGMSGGPAFRASPDGVSFAGIVLRAGARVAHLLRADIVLATLDAYLDGRSRSTVLLRPIR